MSKKIDGIYTAYVTGEVGQSLLMLVFKDGKIGGADMSGVICRGSYASADERIEGKLTYTLPKGSTSVSGPSFAEDSEPMDVPIDLPTTLNANETYRLETPLGPVNVKFLKNMEL